MRARRRSAGLCVLSVALTALLGPAAPGAAAENTEMEMRLSGSNGYTLSIHGGTGLPVTLTMAKSVRRGVLYATYSVDGRVTSEGISANFGRLGHLSASFRSSPRLPDSGCGGRRLIHRKGTFVGTIRFRGEQGFSSVSATRARGYLLRRCTPSSVPRPAAPKARTSEHSAEFFETHFVAAARSSRRSVILDSSNVAEIRPNGQLRDVSALLLAELEEERGRIEIERTLIAVSSPMQTSPLGTTPVTASLKPRRPFGGMGTYVEEMGSPAGWNGDLTVDLPGAKDLRLAGPAFTPILCRGKSGTEKLNRCQNEATDLLVGG